MNTPTPPFYHTSEELLYALLTGGNCIGYEKIEVDDSTISSLNFPLNAVYALLVMEADTNTFDKSRVARFKEADNAGLPTSIDGIPLGDLSIYEVKGKQNMLNFRITGIETAKIHYLTVQYYG